MSGRHPATVADNSVETVFFLLQRIEIGLLLLAEVDELLDAHLTDQFEFLVQVAQGVAQ